MRVWAIFAIALICLPAITDWALDYRFRTLHPDKNIGYSQTDRDGMAAIIGRSLAKTKHRMNSGEQAVAMKGLLESGL